MVLSATHVATESGHPYCRAYRFFAVMRREQYMVTSSQMTYGSQICVKRLVVKTAISEAWEGNGQLSEKKKAI